MSRLPPLDDALSAHLRAHGCLPRLGDARAPWTYRGWMLPYVWNAHQHPECACPDRWGYLFRILELGHLPAEPIPVVDWLGHAGEAHEVQRQIKQAAQRLQERHGYWSGFLRFVDWFAFGLGFCAEQPEIHPEIEEWLYRNINLVPWLEQPYDHLGEYMAMERAQGFNPHAFFPTPMSLCAMMTQMLYGEGDQRRSTVSDCCLGTGRMLLAASNYSLRLSGQDIDPVVLKIAQINGSLYAPWLVWPVPEAVLDAPAPELRADLADAVGRVRAALDELAAAPAAADAVVAVQVEAVAVAASASPSSPPADAPPVDEAVAVVDDLVHPDAPIASPSCSPRVPEVDEAPSQSSSASSQPSPSQSVPVVDAPEPAAYRVDDKGQGLLFNLAPAEKPRSRARR